MRNCRWDTPTLAENNSLCPCFRPDPFDHPKSQPDARYGPRFGDDLPDSLGRLTSATSASSTAVLAWGQSFVYDPFGNLLQQNVTSGSAPAMNLTVDPNTNRITSSGFSYDAAGNLTASPGASGPNAFSYDSENRLSVANGLNYRYGSSGERLFDGANWHFYGPDGTHLGKLTQNTTGDPNWYDFTGEMHFAGRLVWQNSLPVMTDRLGSVVQMSLRDRVNNYAYYPQGQWIANMPTPDQSLPGCWPSCGGALNGVMDVSFGTYHRDGYWSNITGSFVTRGLDYAQNRFYDPARGRFTTADPSGSSGHLQTPLSWNRYSYVMGDPVNSNDPTGLDGQCGPGQTWMGEGCYNYGGASSDLAAAYTQYAGRMQDEFDAGYANSLLRHHGINSSIYLQFMSSHQNLDIRTVVNANFQFSSPQQKALAYLYAAGLFDYIAGAIPSPAHGEGILITWKDGTQNQVKDLLNGGLFDSGPLGREHTGETGPNTDYRSSAFGPGSLQVDLGSLLSYADVDAFNPYNPIGMLLHGIFEYRTPGSWIPKVPVP